MRLDRLRKKREIISHLNIRQCGWYSNPKINPGPCICVNLFLWVNQWIASVPPQYSSILGYFNIIHSRLGAEGCVTSLLCDRQTFAARIYSFSKQPLWCLLVITDVCRALAVCSVRPLATWDLRHCSHFKCLLWGRHSFVFDFCLKYAPS